MAHLPNFAPSRPGTPPSAQRSYEPHRADSQESVVSSSSGSSSSSRRSRLEQPTNTLIITPLPAPFFEPLILDALRQHFASYSTTYVHTSSPPSTSPTLGPGSPNGPKQLEGSLYSWVPLKSLKRAIVVFYNPHDAERARQASDRYYFPPTASTPEITLRVFRGAHTVLVPVQLSGPPPDRFYDVDSDDESAIFESPFHLRPPKPERNFLISPPGSPPVGWEQTQEEPPNEVALAEDLQRALEQLRVRREQEDRDREGAGCESGDMSENEDGILLIPEGEAGVCVRVQNWCHRRRVVVARGSEGWDALDEELSDGEWELPSHVPPVRLGGTKGFKPAPASMVPIIQPPTIGLNGPGGGLMSPSGTMRMQPTARPPPPPGA